MATARTIITKAMQKAGILVKSEQPAADEANDALDALNSLMDSWSNLATNIYARATETFALTSASTYTIGSGQTFNTTRPVQIVDAYVTLGGISYPLEVIKEEDFNSINYKAQTGIPQYLVYDHAYPTGTITIYPTPNSSYSLVMLSEKPLSTFATLDTTVSLPNGWERALVYNLAKELAPEYGQQIDPQILQIANEALSAVRLSIARSRPVFSNEPLLAGNVYNGWFL